MATNKTTTTKTSKTRRVSLAQIMFLIAGLCLLVKYILQNPISTAGVFQFVGSLIVTIVLVGFYVLFVFGLPGYNGAWKTLAPIVLILAICGQYSLNFGDEGVTSAINSIASIVWVVILVSLFVFVFIHKKWLGMIASVTSLVYALLVIVSYIVTAIITAVNGGGWSFMPFLQAVLLAAGLGLTGAGLWIGLRHRDWIN